MDNETGPIQMPDFEIARFDSLHVPSATSGSTREAQQRGSFRGNLSAALQPEVRPERRAPASRSRQPHPAGRAICIIALYYVGMQNYGYKGCPGGRCPCGLDKDPFQADGVAAQRRAPVGAGRHHAGHAELRRAAVHRQLHGELASAAVDAERRHGRRRPRRASTSSSSAASTSARRRARRRVRAASPTTRARIRNFSAKSSSTSTWNPRPWMNLKTSVRRRLHQPRKRPREHATGRRLPPGASTVGAASTRDGDAAAADGGQDARPVRAGAGRRSATGCSSRSPCAPTRTARSARTSSRSYYPKVSLSWIVSDESFFPQLVVAEPVPSCAARTARAACSRARRSGLGHVHAPARSHSRAATARPEVDVAGPHGEPARQPEPQAGALGRVRGRVRRAGAQQQRALRVHILEQEDAATR